MLTRLNIFWINHFREEIEIAQFKARRHEQQKNNNVRPSLCMVI